MWHTAAVREVGLAARLGISKIPVSERDFPGLVIGFLRSPKETAPETRRFRTRRINVSLVQAKRGMRSRRTGRGMTWRMTTVGPPVSSHTPRPFQTPRRVRGANHSRPAVHRSEEHFQPAAPALAAAVRLVRRRL